MQGEVLFRGWTEGAFMQIEEFSLVETERQGLATKFKHSVPQRGIGVNYLQSLLGLLFEVQQSGMVLRRSPFTYRASTMTALRWCISKEYVLRVEDFGRSKFKARKRPRVSYHLTERGKELWRLLR